MEFRVRNFAEKTLQRLRPYYILAGIHRPDKPRKTSLDSQRRQSTSSREHPHHDTIPLNGDTTRGTDRASENNAIDIVHTKETVELITPQIRDRAAEVPVEHDEETKDLQDAPTYTEGSSRVVMAHDGTKACLALLLTDDIVSKINQIATLNRKVEGLQCKFDDAAGEFSMAQICLEESSALIDVTEDSDEQTQVREETTKWEETRDKASKRKEQIEEHLNIYKGNLDFSREESQELFERALDQAGLFTSKSEDEDAVEISTGSEAQFSALSEQRSDITSNTDKTVISVEHLNRLATYEDMLERENLLQTLQDKFDTRRETYNQEFVDYSQAVEDGNCSLSRSEFDGICLSNLRDLTKALADAERGHEYAKFKARALGLVGNDWEQESDFVDDPDDCDYLESLEAELCGGVDRDFIEAWSAEVSDCEDPDNLEDQDNDEWDAETVDISDSISLVDRGRNRRRIDRWREICGV